jgi:hypothetical protein
MSQKLTSRSRYTSSGPRGPHEVILVAFPNGCIPALANSWQLCKRAPGWQGDRMQFNQLRRREFITLLGSAAASIIRPQRPFFSH